MFNILFFGLFYFVILPGVLIGSGLILLPRLNKYLDKKRLNEK